METARRGSKESMRIERLRVENYRSIEEVELAFPSFYTALCGKNDSGKTNVLRAIRALINEESTFYWGEDVRVSFKDDYPKWLSKESKGKSIRISAEFTISSDRDAGLYEFLVTYLSLAEKPASLDLMIDVSYSAQSPVGAVVLTVGGAVQDSLKAQEVLKRLRSSHLVLFHNSTETAYPARFLRQFSGSLEELSSGGNEKLELAMKAFNRVLNKTAKSHQKDLESLLGQLEDKYQVRLSFPELKPDSLPFTITLGDKNIDIDLVDWGSGTKNRTLILLTLFRARKISEAATSASKVVPIIVIEEPESFLHPSAQAQFGTVIQKVAEEFKIQVIVASHSPFLLSQEQPAANILLERKIERKKLRETCLVQTAQADWMKPFGLALGIDNDDLKPWYDMFFGARDSVLMVEGDIDKEYFELLRDPKHGKGALRLDGQIFAYNGVDNLSNAALIKYMKSRHRSMVVTYDLDVEEKALKCLARAGIEKGKQAFAIGSNTPGRRNIEGLLPDVVLNQVYSQHTQLVQQAASGTGEERKSACSNLKHLYLEAFKAEAAKGTSVFGGFYPVVHKMNRALTGELESTDSQPEIK
jgi:putative ATP-dependent endonuclease of OLD family